MRKSTHIYTFLRKKCNVESQKGGGGQRLFRIFQKHIHFCKPRRLFFFILQIHYLFSFSLFNLPFTRDNISSFITDLLIIKGQYLPSTFDRTIFPRCKSCLLLNTGIFFCCDPLIIIWKLPVAKDQLEQEADFIGGESSFTVYHKAAAAAGTRLKNIFRIK